MLGFKKLQWPLGIICIIGAIFAYRRINSAFETEVPKVTLHQWWGDGPEPKDWAAYVKNSSEVLSNRLIFPDSVWHS